MTYPREDSTGRVHFDESTSATRAELSGHAIDPSASGARASLSMARSTESWRAHNAYMQGVPYSYSTPKSDNIKTINVIYVYYILFQNFLTAFCFFYLLDFADDYPRLRFFIVPIPALLILFVLGSIRYILCNFWGEKCEYQPSKEKDRPYLYAVFIFSWLVQFLTVSMYCVRVFHIPVDAGWLYWGLYAVMALPIAGIVQYTILHAARWRLE